MACKTTAFSQQSAETAYSRCQYRTCSYLNCWCTCEEMASKPSTEVKIVCMALLSRSRNIRITVSAARRGVGPCRAHKVLSSYPGAKLLGPCANWAHLGHSSRYCCSEAGSSSAMRRFLPSSSASNRCSVTASIK